MLALCSSGVVLCNCRRVEGRGRCCSGPSLSSALYWLGAKHSSQHVPPPLSPSPAPPFSSPPLPQMLISGGQQGLDIADMAAHVQYSGGYHAEHPVIQEFWKALATFSPREQADFLRFVTSCPRPPLLGFKYVEPPLAIQVGGGCWLMLLGGRAGRQAGGALM